MGLMEALRDLLFPVRCMGCGKVLSGGTGLWCRDCLEGMQDQERVFHGMFVAPCWTALYYEGGVRDAILRFKFKGNTACAGEFGKILAQCVAEHLSGQYDLITWVPVSRERKRQRGYDQAMLLAEATALELQDVAAAALEKIVDNPAQSGLKSRAERKSNVLGAYRVTDPELVAGKRILLLDDIVTTGATIEEAGRTLLSAGAKTVVGAALARPEEHTKDSE